MKKREGSIAAILVAVSTLILLTASAYLGIAAVSARKTAQGKIFLRNGEFSRALVSFKDAERFNKYILRRNPQITEGLAESYFGLGDLDSAKEYYLRIALADVDNANAAYRMGLIHIEEKNFDKGEEQIKKLEAMNTYEAKKYAENLSELISENSIKGVFKNIYDRLAPGIPGLPGLQNWPGALRDKLQPDQDTKEEDRKPEIASPDANETENSKDNRTEATI